MLGKNTAGDSVTVLVCKALLWHEVCGEKTALSRVALNLMRKTCENKVLLSFICVSLSITLKFIVFGHQL